MADLPEHNILEFFTGEEFPAQRTKQMSKVVAHIFRPLDEGWHRIRFVVDFEDEPNFVLVWRIKVVDDDDKAAQR